MDKFIGLQLIEERGYYRKDFAFEFHYCTYLIGGGIYGEFLSFMPGSVFILVVLITIYRDVCIEETRSKLRLFVVFFILL